MGWLFTARRAGLSARAFLDAEFTSSTPQRSHTILKSVMVGSIYYAAAQVQSGDEAIVYALVALTRSNARAADGLTFGYKDMSEDAGPCETSCPASILDLLSEARSDNARRWRRECRQHTAIGVKKRRVRTALNDGDQIRLTEAIAFRDGSKLRDFTVTFVTRGRRKTMVFKSLKTGGLYRIDRIAERGFEPLPPDDGAQS